MGDDMGDIFGAARRGARFAAGFVASFAIFTSPAFAACDGLVEEARVAREGANIVALKSVFERANVDSSCDNETRGNLRRLVLRAVERKVDEGTKAGRPPDSFSDEMRDALRYGESWRIQTWLGEAARDKGDHAAAATAYQKALAIINDTTETPKAPDPSVIEMIFKRAESSRMVAEHFVDPPVTRGGTSVGLASLEFRGFKVRKVAVPVEFVFDSVEFTRDGAKAAADLAESLKSGDATEIRLVGHTDSRGAADYNLRLSKRRAEALADFLRRSGVTAPIVASGVGANEPMTLDDPARYTRDQIDRANRRVELLR